MPIDHKKLFEQLERMGVEEVKIALAQKRFGERKIELVKLWLSEQPDLGSSMAKSKEHILLQLAAEFEVLLNEFVSGQFGVLILPTAKEAEFKGLMTEAQATVRELFGRGYEFSSQLSKIEINNHFSDGVSMANVEEVIRSLKGAHRYLTRKSSSSSSTFKNEKTDDTQVRAPLQNTEIQSMSSQKIFIVHGHDHGTLETVARFIEKVGLDPIILHEQASKNQTVIEKLEANSDVGFAIVLLTPDDEGQSLKQKSDGAPPEFRPRQNVVLELGYFFGKLGRNRICALAKYPIELPSDYAGVLCEDMDQHGAWKRLLARELKAAGYTINSDALL